MPLNPIALIAATLFLVALALPGIALLRRFAPSLDRLEQLAYGAPFGLTAGTLGLLLLACRFGLTSGLILGWAIFCAAAGGVLAARTPRPASAAPEPGVRRRLSRGAAGTFVVLGLIALRWAVLWSSALTVDHDGLSAGFVNLWGDWAMHLGDVASFAYGDNFPPMDPRFWGQPLAYHYLASLTVAAMVRLGLDPVVAMPLHSFLLSIAILLGLFVFARRFLGDRAAATLSVVLFLFGGGWGWILPLRAGHADGGLALLAPHWNAGEEWRENFRWLNIYFSILAPQRPCLYGVPLGMLTLSLLETATRGEGGWRRFALAGFVAGLLPLAHTGTLLTLALTVPFLMLLFPTWGWIAFLVVLGATAFPQMIRLVGHGPGPLSSARFHLGWIAAPDPWLWFWLKNLGFILPLAIAGFLWRDAIPARSRRFLLGLMPVFVLANLFLFLPWDWDNTKVLTFWFLATCLLASAVIVKLWRRPSPALRLALAAVVASMVLSGVMLNVDQLLGRDRHVLADPEELELARRIRETTPPHALFAAGRRHNHPVSMLTGRRVLVGYGGWLWSHGVHGHALGDDLLSILADSEEAPALRAKYGVDYVVIGPEEREQMGADEAAYAAHFPVVIATPRYRVYAVGRGR